MKHEIDCCLKASNLAPKYVYSKKDLSFIVEHIHAHIHRLLGSTIYYYMESYADKLAARLENIKCSNIIVPIGTSLIDLKAFFDGSPKQEFMRIHGDLNGKLTKNSALFTTEYLEINCSKSHGDDILLGFKGISIRFQDTMFHASTITRFLNAWKSGKGFHNLKFLSITGIPEKCLDKKKLAENVEIKTWHPPEEMLELEWKERKYKSADGSWIWEDRSFSSNQYLTRTSDGEGASVRVTMFSFDFAVWSALENLEVIENI
ncbi:hypothetical protein GCK72_016514 [Caenorhabditis remanei]|uniref:F-box associated domain-containing protein n=1 Tax=Caenorhabditis remanei TaxID=31234 RepID=A0A6A5G640_CAERE|nr:hypothetical protein GCK72_016514 [Caenorhabditis remanei]KAF1749969.1 hypothetical protein GCK72_016514 [Caenorhabditis remanei]